MESKVENKSINKYQNIEFLDFNNINNFTEYIADLCNNVVDLYKIDKEIEPTVVVFGQSDFIARLFTTLIGDYMGFSIGLLDFGVGCYNENGDKEYALTISCFDGLVISIESAYNENDELYNYEGYLLYNQDDCKQVIIDKALDNNELITIFGIDTDDKIENSEDYEDDDCDCSNCDNNCIDCIGCKHHRLIIRDGNIDYIYKFDGVKSSDDDSNDSDDSEKDNIKDSNDELNNNSDIDTKEDIEKGKYDTRYHCFIGTKHLSIKDLLNYLSDIFVLHG